MEPAAAEVEIMEADTVLAVIVYVQYAVKRYRINRV
jgi:hypothetical protein